MLGRQGHPSLLSFTPYQKKSSPRGEGVSETYYLSGNFFLALAALTCLLSPWGRPQLEIAFWGLWEEPFFRRGNHTVPQTLAPQNTQSDL